MNKSIIKNKLMMDITDFYTIETPPSSSSTSKDSTDESLSSFQSKNKLKLSTKNIGQISNNNTIICSTSKSNLTINPINIKDNEVNILLLFLTFICRYILLSLLNNIFLI
jgi:hypothetical protein